MAWEYLAARMRFVSSSKQNKFIDNLVKQKTSSQSLAGKKNYTGCTRNLHLSVQRRSVEVEPLDTIAPMMLQGFQEDLRTEDASLSDSCTPDQFSFSSLAES